MHRDIRAFAHGFVTEKYGVVKELLLIDRLRIITVHQQILSQTV